MLTRHVHFMPTAELVSSLVTRGARFNVFGQELYVAPPKLTPIIPICIVSNSSKNIAAETNKLINLRALLETNLALILLNMDHK